MDVVDRLYLNMSDKKKGSVKQCESYHQQETYVINIIQQD